MIVRNSTFLYVEFLCRCYKFYCTCMTLNNDFHGKSTYNHICFQFLFKTAWKVSDQGVQGFVESKNVQDRAKVVETSLTMRLLLTNK